MARKGKEFDTGRDPDGGGRERGEKEIGNLREEILYIRWRRRRRRNRGDRCGRIKTDRENVVSFLITRRIKSLDFSFYLGIRNGRNVTWIIPWVAASLVHSVYVKSLGSTTFIYFFFFSFFFSSRSENDGNSLRFLRG